MLSKRSKWLVLLLSLVSVPVGNAGLTKTDCVFRHVCRAAPFDTLSSTSSTCTSADATDNIDIAESRLAGLGSDFLKPPVDFTGAAQSTVQVQPLPAVPGALLLALTGFLCVSLVKDRRFWFTALAGLLWVGQAGIQSVPNLALRLGHRIHNHHRVSADLVYPYLLENSRLRSDIEGTQYIGLLRHLAGIPHKKISFLQKQRPHQAEDEVRVPQHAVISISPRLIFVIDCLTFRIMQFVCFSPAFIFENLPRPPPIII